MWKSPWDWKLFSTGGASARSLWKQWQHQAIPSRSCQRLSSKLPVGHKKIGKKSFLMLNVHHNNIGDGQIWIPSSRDGGSLFHFWIALFPTRLKLGISFAFHYSSPNQIDRHINLSIAKKIKDIMSGQVFLSSDRTRPLLSCPKRIRDKFVPFFTCGIFWASKRRRGGLKVGIWYLFLLKGVYFTKVNFVIAMQDKGKVNRKCKMLL